MSRSPVTVIYEDNHLLALAKPALLATMGTVAGTPTLLSQARDYIRRKYRKPGQVYLGVVSRLDAPVTGLVLLARTSKAAARLTEAFHDRQVEKVYWAVVSGRPPQAAGRLVHWLHKDERHHRVKVSRGPHAAAQKASLSYRTLESWADKSLLEVRLETGRKHQIRVQLAELGCPVCGDLKYGSAAHFAPGIALHSRRLAIEHPVRRTRLVLTAPLPGSWQTWPIVTALARRDEAPPPEDDNRE